MKAHPYNRGRNIVAPLAKFFGSAAAVAFLAVATSAQAQLISGTIQFSGGAQLDNANLALATRFVSIFGPSGPGSNPGVIAGTETGNYVGIPNGTPAVFTPFVFNPAQSSVLPLWSLTNAGVVYSFDATSVTVVYQDSFFLDISGQGIAHITGMTDTVGTWSITDTGGDGSVPVFTFGAATQVGSPPPPTPEPATWALFAVLLLPLAWRYRIARRVTN